MIKRSRRARLNDPAWQKKWEGWEPDVLAHPRVKALQAEIDLVILEMQRWFLDRRNHEVMLHVAAADRLKLLKFRTWEFLYKVPVAEILDIIVEPIAAHSRLRGTRWRYGIGTSISSLTGEHAERILSIIVGRKYPAKENVGFWREAERDKELRDEQIETLDGALPREAYIKLMESESVDNFVKRYSKRITTLRDMEYVEGDAGWRRRKAYRNNPWR